MHSENLPYFFPRLMGKNRHRVLYFTKVAGHAHILINKLEEIQGKKKSNKIPKKTN
jgi:hypothetical protein